MPGLNELDFFSATDTALPFSYWQKSHSILPESEQLCRNENPFQSFQSNDL